MDPEMIPVPDLTVSIWNHEILELGAQSTFNGTFENEQNT